MPRFVPRQRKHKKLQRNKDGGVGSNELEADSNALELPQGNEAEKEQKRQRLREELQAQRSGASSKKKKRLDKYIDTKLRKEENLDLIKKLSQQRHDTTLLRSSRELGQGKQSKRSILTRALRERHLGIDVEKNDELLLEERERPSYEQNHTITQLEEDTGRQGSNTLISSNALVATDKASPSPLFAGSGLKRPHEVDARGLPLLKKQCLSSRDGGVPESSSQSSDGGSIFNGFDSVDEEDIQHISREEAGGLERSVMGDELSRIPPETESCSDSDDNDFHTGFSSVSSSGDEAPEDGSVKMEKRERASAFKAWASKSRNDALGHQPFYEVENFNGQALEYTPRLPESDPLPPELETTRSERKAYHVMVKRTEEINTARSALPVVAEEQKIMEAIHNNTVVVIWGATGSGKTTQIPQFLFEAGYGDPNSATPGLIGVTQPRRVAAVSMAQRVEEELNQGKSKVAYQIRFEGTVKKSTAVKFMTDGILLREASQDITLRKYSAIIIDEAHERSKDTDILIGMLSRIVKLREQLGKEDPRTSPLKLVIMSATLKVSDFTDNKTLFAHPPPLIQAEGRQHPVTIHWARHTKPDFVSEAFDKIVKGHRQLPAGGMLVFLTGQDEITQLSKKLREHISTTKADSTKRSAEVKVSGDEVPLEAEDMNFGSSTFTEVEVDSSDSETESSILAESTNGDDADFRIEESQEKVKKDTSLHILPLYSLLPTKDQLKVFETSPEGSRKVVLATNIAETSLTIPGIRYVFDCGRAKERKYDDNTSVQSFEIGWISKANASQRAGRAGRTGPGHCYRLYSSAVYERDFPEYPEPEIRRTPIEGIVLQLSGLNVPNILEKFPFPSRPDISRLIKAQQLLKHLGALSFSGRLTDLGQRMSTFPLSPRFAKMLLVDQHISFLPFTIAVVAAMAVPQLFIPESHPKLPLSSTQEDNGIMTQSEKIEQEKRERLHRAYKEAHYTFCHLSVDSDALKLLAALLAHERSDDKESFCNERFLRPKAMHEAQLLRCQLTRFLLSIRPKSELPVKLPVDLPDPTRGQIGRLRQLIAAGYVDQVAIRGDSAPFPPETDRKPRKATKVPYLSLFPSEDHNDRVQSVYIHPSSILAYRTPDELPQYLVYSHLHRSDGTQKVYMHPLTAINGAQLTELARETPLLSYSKPIKQYNPKELTDGKREVWVIPTLRGPLGGQGWPLPAEKQIQQKIQGVWTRVP